MKWKYYLYLALFMPVAVLPFWALYLLSDGLYLLFYKVLRYRLHVVRQNLSMAFPEKTEAERRAIEKEFYRQFCDNIVETVKLLCVSDKGITSRIEVINSDCPRGASDCPLFGALRQLGVGACRLGHVCHSRTDDTDLQTPS